MLTFPDCYTILEVMRTIFATCGGEDGKPPKNSKRLRRDFKKPPKNQEKTSA